MDSINSDRSRGSKDGVKSPPNLVHMHPLLDSLLPNDHLLNRASHLHGPQPWLLRRPLGLPLLLPLYRHPPLHLPQREAPRPLCPPLNQPPQRHHQPPKNCRRPCLLCYCHGLCCHCRKKEKGTFTSSPCANKRLLASPPVLLSRCRGGVRICGSAGVLHYRGP